MWPGSCVLAALKRTGPFSLSFAVIHSLQRSAFNFPGAMWLGKYEIIDSLGEGGTSEVFLALSHGPGGFERPVVLKRMLAHRASDPAYVADFAREARAYARLDHPAIVTMHDFFEHAGQPILVLEYVDGMSLQTLLARLQERGQPLSDTAALYVGHQIFSALASAHDARDRSTGRPAYVVHRDVTPCNVLLAWDGRVKLTDFGIAKLAGVQADTEAEGLIKGTFGYMAPEQLLTKDATVRTDVYQGCLLLRELLLGQQTFVRGRESQVDFLERLARPSLPDIDGLRAGVPPPVCKVLKLGLRPRPEDRAITAARIRDVLASSVDLAQGCDTLVTVLAATRKPRSAPEQCAATRRASFHDSRGTFEAFSDEDPRSEIPSVGPSSISAVATEKGKDVPRPAVSVAVLRLAPYAVIGLLGLVPSAPMHQTAHAEAGGDAFAEAVLPIATDSTASAPEPTLATTAVAPTILPEPFGEITTLHERWPHRIFVDGRALGQTGETLRVRCGRHDVRLGSQGRLQRVEVPCSGTILIKPLW